MLLCSVLDCTGANVSKSFGRFQGVLSFGKETKKNRKNLINQSPARLCQQLSTLSACYVVLMSSVPGAGE